MEFFGRNKELALLEKLHRRVGAQIVVNSLTFSTALVAIGAKRRKSMW
jgi:hypothetical protein